MKFSYATLLQYPLADSIEMIKTADELGYYACYAVDETWHSVWVWTHAVTGIGWILAYVLHWLTPKPPPPQLEPDA